MREEWIEKTFEELSSKIGDGLHGTPKYDMTGDFFFVNGNNLNNGIIEIKEGTKRVNEDEYNKHFKPLTSNTVLISINGTLGKVAFYNNEPIILGKSACYINFNDNVDKRYIKYHIQSLMFFKNMTKEATGMTIKNFSLKSMRNYKLPLPPLSEQKKIVTILDNAITVIDQAKANIEKNIENAKELFQSKLNEIFSQKGDDWEQTRIGEICDLMTGGTPSRKNKEYFNNGTINWLVSGDINKKEITECEGKITELGLNNSSTRYLPINSVMIALNGQGKTRGTVAMLRIKATCNQSLVSIYPKDKMKILPEYIYSNLKSRYIEIRRMTGDSGNDRRGLNMPLIRSINVFVPISIEKQREIIELQKKISADLDLLISNYLKKLTSIVELKRSILQKAFSGELTQKESVS